MDRAKAQYYLDFAEKFRLVLPSPAGQEGSERLEAFDQDLRDALAWFIDNNETDKAMMLVSILWRFWMDKGHVEEGRKLTTILLNQLHNKPRTTLLAEVFFGAGMLAFRQEDNREAIRLFQESLAVSRETNDRSTTVKALTGLARTALRDGNYALVKARSEEARAIAKSVGDEFGETRPLHMLAAATKMEGDLSRARELYEESLMLARKLGDVSMESTELDNLGSVALHMGDLKKAKDWYRQAGQIIYKTHNMYMLPYVPLHFSMVALEEGKLERAVRLLGASEAQFQSSGMSPDPDESIERDRTISKLRIQVDETNFSKLWAEGRKLSLDQTVHYSLES